MARFTTGEGKFVGFDKLPNGVLSLWQSVVRKTTGRIPRRPWIPFSAAQALAEILNKRSFVWEIGSGFSTLWLSDCAGKIVSIEASPEWFERLGKIIQKENRKNVDLRYEWEAERMADFSELEDGSLDLLFIDGGPRDLCFERGLRKVRKGGYIYLDNWDDKLLWNGALDLVDRHSAFIAERRAYIDYVPAQVGVYEGLLLKKA